MNKQCFLQLNAEHNHLLYLLNMLSRISLSSKQYHWSWYQNVLSGSPYKYVKTPKYIHIKHFYVWGTWGGTFFYK